MIAFIEIGLCASLKRHQPFSKIDKPKRLQSKLEAKSGLLRPIHGF